MINVYQQCNLKTFKFSGGELQVSASFEPEAYYDITARLNNCDDVVELLLIDEILCRKRCIWSLTIPYLPYGRQDRVMQNDEAFSLKMMAKLLNGLSCSKIITYDCHSPVTNALVDKLVEVKQLTVLTNIRILDGNKHSIIIAPDAGASKKSYEIASHYKLPFIVAEKIRDTSTGEITHTKIDAEGEAAFIIDDICDGGRTFIELAKSLRQKEFKRIYLYITHGIFSQGLDVFDGLIDGVFTTNTFREQEKHPLLTTFRIVR